MLELTKVIRSVLPALIAGALLFLSSASASDLQQYTYVYNESGRISGLTRPNGVTSLYEYDSNKRLTRVAHFRTGLETPIADYRYSLKANGQREGIEEHDELGLVRRVAYQYDGLGRLTEENVSHRDPSKSFRVVYTYDRVGNRKTQTVSNAQGSNATQYTYNGNDELVSEVSEGRSTSYHYDGNGNLASKHVQATGQQPSVATYRFDDNNRLREVRRGIAENSMALVVSYDYDPGGNLTRATYGNGALHKHLIDTNRRFSELIEEETTFNGGTSTKTYLYGHSLLSQTENGAEFFYLKDGLGSTRLLVDSGGEVVARVTYSAAGEVLDEGNPPFVSSLFAGQWRDNSTGYYFLRSRWFDPSTGRFLTPDSFPGASDSPVTTHRYTYANNDPVNRVDPLGTFGLSEFGAAEGIRSVLADIQINVGTQFGIGFISPDSFAFDDLALVSGMFIGGVVAWKILAKLAKVRKAAGPGKAAKKAAVGIANFPRMSNGMSNAQLGQLVRWGRGEAGVRAALKKGYTKADVEYFKEMGLTREDIEALRTYYGEFQKVVSDITKDPTPSLRAKLMSKILELW